MSESYQYLEESALVNLRERQRQNLSYLAAQAANYGVLAIPLHLHNQINSTKGEIDQLNAELGRRGVKIDDPPPGSSLQTVINHYHSAVDQRTINTGGGDYAEGNIDKRGSVSISGGTVHGPVVGSNEGTINYSPRPNASQQPDGLRQALTEAQKQLTQARQQGAATTRALINAEFSLETALKASEAGKSAERQQALDQARQDLQPSATAPELQPLLRLLERL